MRQGVVQGTFAAGGLRRAERRPAALGCSAQRAGAGTVEPLDAKFLSNRDGGRPLPEAVQHKMQAAFGADFSDVRVHEGPQAATIGAIAFTVGHDIYFAPGRYQPQTAHGQQLLGHELAHVLQQRAGRVRNSSGSGFAIVHDHALEAEADRLGHRAAASTLVSPAGPAAQAKLVPAAAAAPPRPGPPTPACASLQRKSATAVASVGPPTPAFMRLETTAPRGLGVLRRGRPEWGILQRMDDPALAVAPALPPAKRQRGEGDDDEKDHERKKPRGDWVEVPVSKEEETADRPTDEEIMTRIDALEDGKAYNVGQADAGILGTYAFSIAEIAQLAAKFLVPASGTFANLYQLLTAAPAAQLAPQQCQSWRAGVKDTRKVAFRQFRLASKQGDHGTRHSKRTHILVGRSWEANLEVYKGRADKLAQFWDGFKYDTWSMGSYKVINIHLNVKSA
ncbi:MAG: DUF4157 domain-containing protein [Rhodospirillales bacterium]|nr:DUF4157 domain-containing protein [Rhodospirillales bacterium]